MQCRFVGRVPWSPRLQSYCDTIKYWSRIVQLRKGVATSRTTLKHLAQKLRLYQGYYATLPSAVQHLKLAYSAYRKAKLLAPDWRDEHNLSLIEALVAEGKPQNKDAAQIRARMKREQYQRDLGLASRTIRQSTNKYSVLKAIAPDEDRTDQILETQEEMVPAMARSNLSRQQ